MHETTWLHHSLVLPEGELLAWHHMFAIREIALAELEKARRSKLIGKALEAKAELTGGMIGVLVKPNNFESLRELLNVSQISAQPSDEALKVRIAKADGQKCERCWHWETDVGSQKEHPTICGRCVEAVSGCLAAREATSS